MTGRFFLDSPGEDLYNNFDIGVESLSLSCASAKVGIRLNDPPYMEHEVEIYLHESAECGRSVG